MINNEKKKQKLLLAYKIADLYRKSEVSASTISKLTSVPLSTVKRSLNAVGTQKSEYLKLLPNIGDEEFLNKFQEEINEQIYKNKKINRWDTAPTLSEEYQKDFNIIKELYEKTNPIISDEAKTNIKILHINGNSIREISKATGYSLGSIHKIINSEYKEEKGNHK